ncbi:MAG: hypothetical protein AB7N76_34715 [Planctomycetota bacterium]
MRPRLMIAALCGVNVLLGFGLGIAADRKWLAPAQPAHVAELPAESPEPHTTAGSPGGPESPEPAASTAPVTTERKHRRRPSGGGRGPWMGRLFTERLGIDAAQQKAIGDVLADTHKRFKALMDPVRPQMEKVHQESEAAILAILTPEQRVLFEALKKERGSRSWGGRPNRRPGADPRRARDPRDPHDARGPREGRPDGAGEDDHGRRGPRGSWGRRGPEGPERPEGPGPQGPQPRDASPRPGGASPGDPPPAPGSDESPR